MKKIIIVDYGMGNLFSIKSAINKLGYTSNISSSEKEIIDATHIILPGVGEFRKAMDNLKKLSLDRVIIQLSKNKKVKILGICLGMQLLCNSSVEGGKLTKGLGLINADIVRLDKDENYKLPHIGFNEVEFMKDSIFSNNSSVKIDFYFVHSYCLANHNDQDESILGFSHYKNRFISYFQNDPIYATQFHPEKSQTNGLKLLKLFLDL